MKAKTLKDLMREAEQRGPMKLLSVRLPTETIARVDAVTETLGAAKQDVVVALLVAGLETHGKK